MFEAIGMIGIALSVFAYVPQVVHLAREHCSAGISSRSWAMWMVSGVLIGALAVHRGDWVFMLLQLTSLTAAILILALAHRYRGQACQGHEHLVSVPATGGS